MQEFMPMATEFFRNHPILIVAWVAIFLFTIYTFFKAATDKFKTIANDEAISLINNEEARVLDLRTVDEFNRGHIINAINILPTEIKNHNLGKIEQHKEQPVILVDVNGLSANASAQLLIKQGFARVYILKDGISAWTGSNLPLVKKHK